MKAMPQVPNLQQVRLGREEGRGGRQHDDVIRRRTLKKNEMVLGNPVHTEATRNKLGVSGAPAGIAIPALRKIESPTPSKES